MSEFRYKVNFEAAPIMKTSSDGRTTISETVYCNDINVRTINGVPYLVDFLDDDGEVFSVNFEKFVSAERVSKDNDN